MGSSDKNGIRREAIQRRKALDDCALRSDTISKRLLQEFPPNTGSTWLVYVSVRDEVRTFGILEKLLVQAGRVIVPYCLSDNTLGLFELTDMNQLERGSFGIREPIAALRADRAVSPDTIDTVIMPGVAFDRRGNRIGYGKGYFDRLLERLRGDCRIVGLAFDCQIFSNIPTEAHDLPVNHLVTETQLIHCKNEI